MLAIPYYPINDNFIPEMLVSFVFSETFKRCISFSNCLEWFRICHLAGGGDAPADSK